MIEMKRTGTFELDLGVFWLASNNNSNKTSSLAR